MGWSNQIPNPLIIGGNGVIGEIIVLDADDDVLVTIDEDGIIIGPDDDNRIVMTREEPGNISTIQLFDGSTIVGELAATTGPFDLALRLAVAGDSDARWYVRADGGMFWGPGNVGADTNLYRSAADTLKTDDSLVVTGTVTIGADTNLYRSAADTLKTDDSLVVAGTITAGTTQPTPVLVGIRGTVVQSVTAATSFTTAVSFGRTLPSIPNIPAPNINSGSGTTANWHARAINITTTGFTLFGFGPSTTFTNVNFQWVALCEPA